MTTYLDLIDQWVDKTRFIVREPADAKELRIIIADLWEETGNTIIPPLLRKAKPRRYWPIKAVAYYRCLMTPIHDPWTTERGQIILYKDLEDQHLIHILVYLRLRVTYQFRLIPSQMQEQLALLMIESEKRGLRLEAEKAIATAIARRAGGATSANRQIFRSITSAMSDEDMIGISDLL